LATVVTSPASAFLARCRAEPALAVLAITVSALCLAWLIVPNWTNVTPLLACAFLLALLLRRASSSAAVSLAHPENAVSGSSPVSAFSGAAGVTLVRTAVFILLECAVFALIAFTRGRVQTPVAGEMLAAVRYAVLLPPLALLPWQQWRRFVRTYRAEVVAAAIAMITWFPHRLFMAAWPYYSQVLGHTVYVLARPFVAYLHYVADATPTLVGPTLDTTILFGCSGLQAIKLFQMLFAFMLIVDWPVFNRRRVLQGYFAGLGVALLANLVRIVLLVVLGNRLSADVVVDLHVGAGWVFFAAVFSLCMWFAYDWLRGSRVPDLPAQAASALPAATAR